MDLDMKVLVVDDIETMRRNLKSILRRIGFTNITEADDGSTALAALKKDKVDLIISDWNMPKVTGLELLKAVRSNESTKDTPFLMIAGDVQKENVVQAFQAGVSNFIVKPFSPEAIKKKLEQIFQ